MTTDQQTTLGQAPSGASVLIDGDRFGVVNRNGRELNVVGDDGSWYTLPETTACVVEA